MRSLNFEPEPFESYAFPFEGPWDLSTETGLYELQQSLPAVPGWLFEAFWYRPDYVRWVQGLLNRIYNDAKLVVDGVFGDGTGPTGRAVSRFQAQQKLVPDAKLGPNTHAALTSVASSVGVPGPPSPPKPVAWGVDSDIPANQSVPSGGTLFDHVSKRGGRPPAFWGRYIGDPGRKYLNQREADFLHSKKCKILLIYNGANATSVQGNLQAGIAHAENALKWIAGVDHPERKLNVPHGVVIYADIEADWVPTKGWIQGWSGTMAFSRYGGSGGFYANAKADRPFSAPYCQAFSLDPLIWHSYIFASEPEFGACGDKKTTPVLKRKPYPCPYSATDALKLPFVPFMPPCTAQTVIWQYQECCYGDMDGWDDQSSAVDLDLATEPGIATMW